MREVSFVDSPWKKEKCERRAVIKAKPSGEVPLRFEESPTFAYWTPLGSGAVPVLLTASRQMSIGRFSARAE
eukprot:CAMPEP_0182475024 /NCGR_PEP_ID=MMETSP1319-20130603/26662_1 /TAXON_ID=172717 /ORGANISM="Bolidomonas pacifica, Strain RCC208" /LENGTH=71 /DNA_ID=CAMNT_0024675975 /DNA_START=161 /DNA_END=373 /DNA_ORIENTATION=+